MRPVHAALAAFTFGLLGSLHTAPSDAQTLTSVSNAKVSIGATSATGGRFTTGAAGGIEGPTLSDSAQGGGGGSPTPPPPPPPPPKDYWPDCFICD